MKIWALLIYLLIVVQTHGQVSDKRTRESSWFGENLEVDDCNLSWMDVELRLFVRYTTTLSQSIQLRWGVKDGALNCLADKTINVHIDLELEYTNNKRELLKGHFNEIALEHGQKFHNLENEFRVAHQGFWSTTSEILVNPADMVSRFLSDDLIRIRIIGIKLESHSDKTQLEETETIGGGQVGFPCLKKCSNFILDRDKSFDGKFEKIEISLPLSNAVLYHFKHPGPPMEQIYEEFPPQGIYTTKHLRQRVEHVHNNWKAVTWVSIHLEKEIGRVIRAYQLPNNKGVLVFAFSTRNTDPEATLILYENLFLKKLKLLK